MLRRFLLLAAMFGLAAGVVGANVETISRAFTLEHASVTEVSAAVQPLLSEAGSLTPTELSRLMFRSKHSITKIIDGLEREGYVARYRDDRDRRVVHVKITSVGVAHMRETLAIENPMVRDLLSCLGDAEADIFLSQIKILRKEVIKALLEKQAEGGS